MSGVDQPFVGEGIERISRQRISAVDQTFVGEGIERSSFGHCESSLYMNFAYHPSELGTTRQRKTPPFGVNGGAFPC